MKEKAEELVQEIFKNICKHKETSIYLSSEGFSRKCKQCGLIFPKENFKVW